MALPRRDFIKIVTAGSASIMAGDARAGEKTEDPQFQNSVGVLVDTTICIGCRKCEWGCEQANKLCDRDKTEYEDKSVYQIHRRPLPDKYTVVNAVEKPGTPENPYYLKVQCMHCNYPACVSACLVGALVKTPEGPVTYDAWKCMGCRYCMVACPFQIPAYEFSNAFSPQVRKCGFCYDRLKEGKKIGCIEACPNEALTFGKRGELLELAHNRIIQSPERYIGHVYGEHEVGGTSWMYLAGVDFSKTELPALPSGALPEITESIQHGIFKAFVPPIALYGLLALTMHAFREKNAGKEDPHERP